MNDETPVDPNDTDETPSTVDPDDPTTVDSLFAFDLSRSLTMNDVVYDAANDELVINNLPFDGPDGRYDYYRGQGNAGIYESRQTAVKEMAALPGSFLKKDSKPVVVSLARYL